MLRFFLELLLLTPSRLFCCLCCLCSLVCCFRSFFFATFPLPSSFFAFAASFFDVF